MVAIRNGTRAATKRLTKIPTRVVKADDLAVNVDGVEYFIHEGDWVEFVGGNQTMGDYLSFLEIAGTDAESLAADETASRRATATFTSLMELIQASIVSWLWHDQQGIELASPPTVAELRRLDFGEIFWLRGGGKINVPLADESPST